MHHTLGEIAEVIHAELHGDPQCRISGVAALQNAAPGDLSFLANRRYFRYLKQTRADAVIVAPGDRDRCPVHALVTDDPYLGYVRAARFLNPEPAHMPGVCATAVVDADAVVAQSAFLGPNCVVGPGAEIGEQTYVGPGCVVGADVIIGRGSRLVANVTLCTGVKLGERVILHPGVVIGSDGFGMAREDGRWLKIPQLGITLIGCDVEIGANSTVDRGTLENTVIGDGVKIDNHVHIGHNVRIGAHTVIAGGTVVGGSARIGQRCIFGGAVAVNGHIEITDDVTVSGVAAVINSIRRPGTYCGGSGMQEKRVWSRNTVRLMHLDELAKKVEALVEAVTRLKIGK